MTGEGPLAARFGLTVNAQNVLDVRAVILQEAQELRDMLSLERENVFLPPLGGDPVSGEMSGAFNAVTRGLLEQATRHVDSLYTLCEELVATAKGYGHTEAEIKASFTPDSPRTTVSQLPAALRQESGMSVSSAGPPAESLTDLMTGGQR